MVEAALAWLNLVLGVAGLWMLRHGWRALGETTLRAPWGWAVLAIAVITGIETAVEFPDFKGTAHHEELRFAAAVLALCPTMALLGAKRPQNAAWQFVVATLWAVLALPAFEVWMRGRGELLSIDAVRSWFLVLLIVVGLVNHLPTRFRLAAVQLATAQALLLWPHLPIGTLSELRPPAWVAMGLFVVSVWTVRRSARGQGRQGSGNEVAELRDWSHVWREFRDWFGTVWSVRVMERVNASAAMYGWPVELGWDGFIERGDIAAAGENAQGSGTKPRITPDEQATIEHSLRTLLRRFVSRQWIDERLKVA